MPSCINLLLLLQPLVSTLFIFPYIRLTPPLHPPNDRSKEHKTHQRLIYVSSFHEQKTIILFRWCWWRKMIVCQKKEFSSDAKEILLEEAVLLDMRSVLLLTGIMCHHFHDSHPMIFKMTTTQNSSAKEWMPCHVDFPLLEMYDEWRGRKWVWNWETRGPCDP